MSESQTTRAGNRYALAMNPNAIQLLRRAEAQNRAVSMIETLAQQLVEAALQATHQPISSVAVGRVIDATLSVHRAQLGDSLGQALRRQAHFARRAMEAGARAERAANREFHAEVEQLSASRPASGPPAHAKRYHAMQREVEKANRQRARRGELHVFAMFLMLIALCVEGYVVGWALGGGLLALPILRIALDATFLVGILGQYAASFSGTVYVISSVKTRMEVDEHRHYYERYFRRVLRWILWTTRVFLAAKPIAALVATVLVFASIGRASSPVEYGIAAFCTVLATGGPDTFARMGQLIKDELRPLLVYE